MWGALRAPLSRQGLAIRMSRVGRLTHVPSGEVLLPKVRWCSGFFCKLRGLMFRDRLQPGEGLLMVERRASRSGTSIHMLFMNFSIATVWIDAEWRVVDKVHALPWRLMYAPAHPARYTLEAAPEILEMVSIGDELVFLDKD